MKSLIKFEYRKLWNKVGVTAVITLLILTTVYTFAFIGVQRGTFDENGKSVSGIATYRVLRENSKDLEGVMDEKYIKKLIKKYNASFEKKYITSPDHSGYLSMGGMTKYDDTNYLVNYAYYGPYMSNGNEKMGLDYDFLKSEKSFYKKYKEALYDDQTFAGYQKMNPKREVALKKKINQLKTPFRIGYRQGLANVSSYFQNLYPCFILALAFALASIYAKDSVSGINEMTLCTACGRKQDLKAKWIAGNLFTVSAYILFWAVLLIEHGAVATLDGWNVTAQQMWITIQNINMGTGMVIQFASGLVGVLVAANIIMMLSIKIKKTKLTVFTGAVIMYLLIKWNATYGVFGYFNPLKFSSNDIFQTFFLGNTPVPYYYFVPFLGAVYILISYVCSRMSYRRLKIN